MKILRIFGGILSLVLGILLCVPLCALVWQHLSVQRGSGSLIPNIDSQYAVISGISVGNMTFTGWHMWGLVGGTAFVGILCLVLGFNLILIKEPPDNRTTFK